MNLAQAVAVCLYELVRQAPTPASKSQRRAAANQVKASAGDVERLTLLLYEVLEASGYVKPKVARVTEDKLRRFLRRLDLSAADAELWLGIFRQIQWKLSSAPGS